MDYRNQFLLGNVMDVLKQLPDETMDCVVTSPPYYGLRTYGEAETVWGGTDGCEHRWGDYDTKAEGYTSRKRWQHGESRESNPDGWSTKIQSGGFCFLCSAWRGELGLEPTPELYLTHLWAVFDEVWRVIKKTGTVWVNLGDTYGGTSTAVPYAIQAKGKTSILSHTNHLAKVGHTRGRYDKCLLAVPERFMLGMIDRGWILRNKICWVKPNPMPSSTKDRFTTVWEYVYFFTKAKKYWFDLDAVREKAMDTAGIKNIDADGYTRYRKQWAGKRPVRTAEDGASWATSYGSATHSSGKNPGDVWRITTQPFPEAHFATFPEELARRCIKAGCPKEVCPSCGKGRVRITKSSFTAHTGRTETKYDTKQSTGGRLALVRQACRETGKEYQPTHQTLGWTSCSCGAGYVLGIILDPFGGSGRACHVAWEQGRDFTYIDIKPEYIEMAKDGLEKKMRSIPRAGDDRTAERTGQETLGL